MEHALYASGEYLDKHPSWHVEDSAWKAAHVLRMMSRHRVAPASVVEIGCGAGEILACLQRQLPEDVTFTGYEVSPQALMLTGSRANDRLHFEDGDGLGRHLRPVDLALAMDVMEHVADSEVFLANLAHRARHTIFHIPLDLSLLSLLTGLPVRTRRSAGHVHHYTRAMALAALEDNGFHVLDDFFTRPAIDRPQVRLRARLARLPRQVLATIDERLAATLLGGFSLMVLAEARNQSQPVHASAANNIRRNQESR